MRWVILGLLFAWSLGAQCVDKHEIRRFQTFTAKLNEARALLIKEQTAISSEWATVLEFIIAGNKTCAWPFWKLEKDKRSKVVIAKIELIIPQEEDCNAK